MPDKLTTKPNRELELKEKLKGFQFRYAIYWEEEKMVIDGDNSYFQAHRLKDFWEQGLEEEATISIIDIAFVFMDETVDKFVEEFKERNNG